MPVSSLGGVQLAPGGSNPMLQNFAQGMQIGYMPQTVGADVALKSAQAQQALGRGAYYDAYGNLRQNQAQFGTGAVGQLVQLMQNNPQLQNDPQMMANLQQAITRQTQYGGAVSGSNPGYLAQQIQSMEKYDPQNPALPQMKAIYDQQIGQLRANVQKTTAQGNQAQATAESTAKGGPRGQFIDYFKDQLPAGMVDQAVIGTALQGSTPEVKRDFEYNAAQGNPVLQKSIQGANLKATSNQQLLKQQSSFETFDAAVQPMLEDIGNAVSYYSGPGGALRLRGDQLKQMSGKEPSPEYASYVTALQTQIPEIADNAAKVLGMSRSDASQLLLEQMVGPGRDASIETLTQMNPQIVRQKLQAFSQYLERESATGRKFIGPLSMNPNAPENTQQDATTAALTQQLQGTMQNMQQAKPASTTPPTGMSKEQFMAWYQKNGGK